MNAHNPVIAAAGTRYHELKATLETVQWAPSMARSRRC